MTRSTFDSASIPDLPPWQQERLSRWLQEWEIHLALGGTPSSAPDSDSKPVTPEDVASAPFDTASETFQQGAIRLAPDNWCGGSRMVVEFLVLGRWGEENKDDQPRWMIAPYGPMSEPADPSELKTGREEVGHRVLCLWNARILPQDTLKKSWFIDQAERDEVEDALAVWDHFALGMDLPLRLRSLVGPPVGELGSYPRHDYFVEESGVLAGLDTVLFADIECVEGEAQQEKKTEGTDIPFRGRHDSVPLFGQHRRTQPNDELALAAAELNLPEQKDVSHLLPGFVAIARGSVRRPGEATVLSFSCLISEVPAQPSSVIISWPGGVSGPCSFEEDYGEWVAEIEIEVPWKSAIALLNAGQLSVAPQG